MEHTRSLTEGSIPRALAAFAAPFLLASFLQALYGAVDLFVVGQYSGSAAVSAVAIGSQIMQTITGIILGISTGGTVLIARCIGEENPKGAAGAVGTMTVLFVLLAAVLTPLMALLTGQAIALMETPAEAVAPTTAYLFTCACGIPFIIGYNAVSGIFRGIGDTVTPLLFITIACVVNIGGDFLLVGGLSMGALGAALATVLAQAVSFLAFLFYMRRKGLPFPFHRADIHLDRGAAAAILKVGLPLAVQDALVNVSFLVITAIINTLGLVASAAVGVVEKLIVFAFLPATSCASAVATLTAQNLGAGKPERARRAMWCGAGSAFVFGLLVCIFVQFSPDTLTGIFSRDPDVIASASEYLRSYSLDCMLTAFVFCFNSYFSGYGRSTIAFAHSMAATFGVRIPATYLLSRVASGSLLAIGFAAPAASMLSIVICAFFLHRLHHAEGRV